MSKEFLTKKNILALSGLLLVAIALPVVTILVQQRQELRKGATGCPAGIPLSTVSFTDANASSGQTVKLHLRINSSYDAADIVLGFTDTYLDLTENGGGTVDPSGTVGVSRWLRSFKRAPGGTAQVGDVAILTFRVKDNIGAATASVTYGGRTTIAVNGSGGGAGCGTGDTLVLNGATATATPTPTTAPITFPLDPAGGPMTLTATGEFSRDVQISVDGRGLTGDLNVCLNFNKDLFRVASHVKAAGIGGTSNDDTDNFICWNSPSRTWSATPTVLGSFKLKLRAGQTLPDSFDISYDTAEIHFANLGTIVYPAGNKYTFNFGTGPTATPTVLATCGNGIFEPALGEVCDKAKNCITGKDGGQGCGASCVGGYPNTGRSVGCKFDCSSYIDSSQCWSECTSDPAAAQTRWGSIGENVGDACPSGGIMNDSCQCVAATAVTFPLDPAGGSMTLATDGKFSRDVQISVDGGGLTGNLNVCLNFDKDLFQVASHVKAAGIGGTSNDDTDNYICWNSPSRTWANTPTVLGSFRLKLRAGRTVPSSFNIVYETGQNYFASLANLTYPGVPAGATLPGYTFTIGSVLPTSTPAPTNTPGPTATPTPPNMGGGTLSADPLTTPTPGVYRISWTAVPAASDPANGKRVRILVQPAASAPPTSDLWNISHCAAGVPTVATAAEGDWLYCSDSSTGNVVWSPVTGTPKFYAIFFNRTNQTSAYWGQGIGCAGGICWSEPVSAVANVCTKSTFPDAAGAANGGPDGVVDLLDFQRWKEEANGTLTTKTADFNCNNVVSVDDLDDFQVWKRYMSGH